jgi:dimethylargininase
VFVEDTAVVLEELAIITRPGADSRRGEIDSIAPLLGPYRPLRNIEAPATLDGGDVFLAGKTLFVGRSSRTNDQAVEQVRAFVEPLGYRVVPAEVDGCLHLKTAATAIAADLIICNPECVDPDVFAGFQTIAADRSEPHAANVLSVGRALLVSASFPRTAAMLQKRGFPVDTIEYDELEKAEAGLTCCSLLLSASS